jgi:hypothetical protein
MAIEHEEAIVLDDDDDNILSGEDAPEDEDFTLPGDNEDYMNIVSAPTSPTGRGIETPFRPMTRSRRVSCESNPVDYYKEFLPEELRESREIRRLSMRPKVAKVQEESGEIPRV